jgi:hypothetical protein
MRLFNMRVVPAATARDGSECGACGAKLKFIGDGARCDCGAMFVLEPVDVQVQAFRNGRPTRRTRGRAGDR